MALVTDTYSIPLATGFPMPTDARHSAESYHLEAMVSYDDAKLSAPRKIAVYFHGSGSTDHLVGPLRDKFVAEGWFFYSVTYFGAGGSSPSGPGRYGYGNVNAPHFTAHWVKHSWWPETAYQSLMPFEPDDSVVFLGHSMGAAALLAWAAGYSGRTTFDPVLKGIISAGATVAGLGDYSWNDVNRNINTLTGIVNQLQVKTILAYADSDAYAPPDYARRIQIAIPKDADTYVTSPGNYPHSWINLAANSDLVFQWAYQMITGSPLLNRDGSPMIAGPSASLL